MATFKMIDNNDPNRYAVVIEEHDIKSFMENPEWELVPEVKVEEVPKKASKAKKEEE